MEIKFPGQKMEKKATNEQFCKSIFKTQKYSGLWVYGPVEAVEKWTEPG